MTWLWINLFALLIIKLGYDSGRHVEKKPVQHWLIWFVAIEVLAVNYLYFGWRWKWITFSVLESAVWFIVFDIGWNLYHRRQLFAIGSTAFTDRVFGPDGQYWQLLFKGCYLLVSFILFVLL